MKKLSLILVLTFALGFASCSTNETEGIEQPQQELLQSYKLSRDASGRYSLDYDVADRTDVSNIKTQDNANDIVLTENAGATQNKHSNEFALEGNRLKIGFVEANSGKRTKITIEDKNITFGRGTSGEFLNNYSIGTNDDGTFQLNFTVNENVKTEFVYNETIETYEVHLSRGISEDGTDSFSRTLSVPENRVLKIDFVNHKTFVGRNITGVKEETTTRHPRSIIVLNEGEF